MTKEQQESRILEMIKCLEYYIKQYCKDCKDEDLCNVDCFDKKAIKDIFLKAKELLK